MVSGGLPIPHRLREFERSLLVSFFLHLLFLVYLGFYRSPQVSSLSSSPKETREVRVRLQKPTEHALKRQLLMEEPKVSRVPKRASAIAEWDTSVAKETRKKNAALVSSVGAAALGGSPKSWGEVKFPHTQWPEKKTKEAGKTAPSKERPGALMASGGSVALMVDDETIDFGPASVLSTKAHALAGFQRRLFEPLGARWRPEIERRFYRDPRLGAFEASYDIFLDRSGVIRLALLSRPSGYAALDESILALQLGKWVIPHPPRILFVRSDGSEKSEVKLTIHFQVKVSN